MQGNFFALNADDFAEKDAALFTETRVDKLLVVDPAEPAGVKTTAESHFHRIQIRFATEAQRRRGILTLCLCASVAKLIQRVTINSRDIRNVFGGF